LFCFAAKTIRCAEEYDVDADFSHKTCLPAAAALTDHSSCNPMGSEMYTASTSLLRTSSYEPDLAQPNFFAVASAFSDDLLPTMDNSAKPDLMIAGITDLPAIFEQPMAPNLIFSGMLATALKLCL
jgi:hypothetical protein